MKSKHEIPSKGDFMKAHSFNFIENEKVNSELIHEKNVGKINNEFYKYGHGNTEESAVAKSHGDLSAENKHTSQTHKEASNRAETSIITGSRMDYTGTTPKRYTTECYFMPVTLPIWYTESLLLNIGSTRRKYEEKVYFKTKLRPYRWSETMWTEVKTAPKRIISEVHIPVFESEVHYVSLEPQQIAVGAN